MITIVRVTHHSSIMIPSSVTITKLKPTVVIQVFFPVQKICFRSQDLKGTDLLYLHAVCLQTSGIIHQGQGIMRTTYLNSLSISPSLLFSVFPGVLWLCIVAESLYLTLLFTGGALMTLEQCPCFSVMNKLKLSAFAALCTALSGNTTLLRIIIIFLSLCRQCWQQRYCVSLLKVYNHCTHFFILVSFCCWPLHASTCHGSD